MIEKEILEKLKDIKPLHEIEDNSLLMLLSYVGVTIFILLITYALVRLKLKKDPLSKLKKLDLKNSKEVAYAFSRLDVEEVKENKKELYEKIILKLEKYKYKPKVDSLDDEVVADIKGFLNI